LIKKTHVNLVNLLDAHHGGAESGTVKKFRSVRELRNCALDNGRCFQRSRRMREAF